MKLLEFNKLSIAKNFGKNVYDYGSPIIERALIDIDFGQVKKW